MGEIRNQKTNGEFSLLSRFLVGRASGCELIIDDPRVSGEHATFYFDSKNWVVRDLSSRNGTSVNGIALSGTERRTLELGDSVVFGGADEAWVLVDDSPPDNEDIAQTEQATFDLASIRLEFIPSQDEETVDLVVVTPSGRIPAQPRAYHFLLLTLARARLKDQERGIAESEAGYIYPTDLVPALYPDSETLNVNIFRARKHLLEMGARDARPLIERRAAARQIRIGVSKLTIANSDTNGPNRASQNDD